LPYGITLLSIALALAITLISGSLLRPTPLQLFFLAVMVSAWHGGWRQGLLATVLATLVVNYFLIEPYYSLNITNLETLVRLITFAFTAAIISWLNHSRQVAQNRTESALQTLRDREMQFSRLVESNIIGMAVFDLKGLVVEANDAFLTMVGYTQAEVRSGQVHWRNMTPPEYQEMSDQSVQEVRSTGIGAPFEKEYLCKDGSRVPVLIGSVLAPDDKAIGFVLDLSDRKRIEAEQREAARREAALRVEVQTAKDQLETVLASINDQFLVLDQEWRYTYVNDRVVEVVGKPRESLLGKSVWELFPDLIGTQFYTEVHRAVAEQIPVQYEFFYDSYQRWFQNHIYPSAQGVAILVIDISDRKRHEIERTQAQEALQKANDRFEFAAAAVNCLIYDWNVEQNRIERTEGLTRIFGYSLEEAEPTAQWWGSMIHPEDVPQLMAQEPILSAASDRYAIEYRVRHKEGHYIHVLDQGIVVKRDADGNPIRQVGSTIDISEAKRNEAVRRQVEANLRESETRFRMLADNISQFAWITDASGWIFWYNQRWFDYTGTTLEEMQGWGWQQVHHPNHVERVVEHFRHAIETGDSWEDTFPLRGKDGTYRWFLSRALAIRDETGQIKHWFGTNTDITDRQQTEADLRQKNAILDVINESVPTPIFVKDRQGRIIYANPATLEAIGKPASEVIGYRDVDVYLSPEDAVRVMENDRRIMDSGQTEVVEESPDGVRTFLGVKSPYRNEAGEVIGLIGISSDISDRVQLERDREQILQQEQAAREAAEKANRIKDEFLAVLSHELRTPLNPILGWAKLLRTQKHDEATVERALETIERNAQLQTQLIEDLLDVSRILQGKLRLNASPVDLGLTIQAAVETVRLAAEAKSIQIQTTLEPNIGKVSGDSSRLQQVVWNLLSNAVKFTSAGGRVEVRLAADEEPDETDRIGNLSVSSVAIMTVSDTGKGISPEFLPHVFECFRQADSATTRKFCGLGLGLAIVRQIVELHGGRVLVESPGEGQGTTFTVKIPLLQPHQEASKDKKQSLEDV
jgi:PAS domain S-box-containing protein